MIRKTTNTTLAGIFAVGLSLAMTPAITDAKAMHNTSHSTKAYKARFFKAAKRVLRRTAPISVSHTHNDAIDYFTSNGWSKAQAAGIVGNLLAESGVSMHPHTKGDGGKAYGIGQWHPNRQANFKRVFGKNIRSSSFMEQLKFVHWELNNTESRAGTALKSTNSPAIAAEVFDRLYERSNGKTRGKRIGNAITLHYSNPFKKS